MITMSNIAQKSIMCLAALGAVFGWVASTRADWSLDFESQLPSTVVGRNITLGGGPPSPTYSTPSVDGGVLTLSDPSAAGVGGATVGAIWHEEEFTNVRVSSTINVAGDTNDWLGLTARADETNSNGYFVMFGYGSGELLSGKLVDDSIALFNISSSDPTQGAQAPLTNLDRAHYLELTVIGNEVTGRLLNEAGGIELLSVGFTDTGQGGVPAYVSGHSGLFDFIQFLPPDFPDNVHGTFDNVTSVAIPEPGSLVMFYVGVGLLGCLRLRRRRIVNSDSSVFHADRALVRLLSPCFLLMCVFCVAPRTYGLSILIDDFNDCNDDGWTHIGHRVSGNDTPGGTWDATVIHGGSCAYRLQPATAARAVMGSWWDAEDPVFSDGFFREPCDQSHRKPQS